MSSFWPEGPPTAPERASDADARLRPYWLDRLPARDPALPLGGVEHADLCIVGGGFTGLWAALHAKADDPARDVVLLEAETIGFGASGRNGGFVLSSLSHGIANGPRFGRDVEVFDAAAMQAEVSSPTYRGGLWDRTGAALVDPGRLADGLRAAVQRLGVRIHEHTRADALRGRGADAVEVGAGDRGAVRARRVLLATSAFPPLLRAIRRYVVPVYDYVLVTEP